MKQQMKYNYIAAQPLVATVDLGEKQKKWRKLALHGVSRHLALGLTWVLCCWLAMVLPVAAETGSEAERWAFVGEAYLWGAGIGGDSAAGDEIDISFSDLIENLEIGLMGSVAASKGKWSMLGDLIYLDVQDDTESTANIIGQPEQTKMDVELKAYIGTFGAGYALIESDTTRINMMVGARYLKLEADAEIDIGSDKIKVSDSGSGWDGIVGGYGKTNLNPKWYLTYYADVGTGNSDLTWQASASVNYRFDKVDAVLGYRYLDYEFDDESELIDNLNISGPFAGVKFRF